MRQYRWMVAALAATCIVLFAVSINRLSVVAGASAAPYQLAVSASAANESNVLGSENDPDSPSATLLDSRDSQGVLGNAVRSATNEDMGRIVDVIVDRFGTTRAAVIDFGGFLGVGNRRIAVDWNAVKFNRHNRITVELTRDQVKAAPEYQPGKPVVVLGASASFAQTHVTERMPER